MQFKAIASLLILSVSIVSISALDASNFLQDQDQDQQGQSRGRKRTAHEVSQEPTLTDRAYDVGRSLYSLGSSLGALGWSIGAFTVTGLKTFGAHVQAAVSNPERTQFRTAIARPHLISSLDQPLDYSHQQIQTAPRFRNTAPDILPGRVLSYAALHRDVITLGGVKYRVHFDMQSPTQDSAIDDMGELASSIKVSLLHFEKFKERENVTHYMAVGRDHYQTMHAYSNAYPGVRLYVTLTKEEPRSLVTLIAQEDDTDGMREREAKRRRDDNYERTQAEVPSIQESFQGGPLRNTILNLTDEQPQFDFGMRQSPGVQRQPIRYTRNNRAPQTRMQTRAIDLTTNDDVFQGQPSTAPAQARPDSIPHAGAPTLVVLEEIEIGMELDTNSSTAPSTGQPDVHVVQTQPLNNQRNTRLLNLEDEAELAHALNQYNPERQRNRIQEVYVKWFRELNEKSGLKEASSIERYYEEREPYNARGIAANKVQIQNARVKLKYLAAQQPIAKILRQQGFSAEEIKNAKETLFLNFYDQ